MADKKNQTNTGSILPKSESEKSGFWYEVKQLKQHGSRYQLNLLLVVLGVGAANGALLMKQPINIAGYALAALFFILALSLRIAFEYERVAILRLGRLRKATGPGVFFALPFVDQILSYVDCRIQVTDFSAEKVLSQDAVPVYVDAIIFWMVWDAGKAMTEVRHYQHAVALSAKTALREAIGKHPLTRLLSEREKIGKQLQLMLDSKTHDWGISSLGVEIKDIYVPEALEDAMSKEAQAEREKRARILLSEAEVEIAEQFQKASKAYDNNPEAMQLRSLNLLLQSLKESGSMILVPSDISQNMNVALSAAVAKKQSRRKA